MNTTAFSDLEFEPSHDRSSSNPRRGEPHLVVQILSVMAFGAFSIVGIALAFAAFWLAGLAVTAMVVWTWAGSRTFAARRKWCDPSTRRSINDLAPAMSSKRSTGNSSFDAYRAEMLERLEQENREFEEFLTRLREAHDATEFDQFMDDRANAHEETKSEMDGAKNTA